MHRIDTSTATPDNRFTEGDPAIPVAATVVSASWLNAVQEELAAVITGAGLELDKADNAQLRQAISQAITVAKPGLASKSAPGLVQIGDGLAVTPQGLLSVLLASVSQAGIMRPDGTTCTVNGGVLSVLKQTSEYMEEWRKSWIGVPRPWRSTTLPANHCWANGDFISFSDWPELQTVSDSGGLAGMLLPWDADSATQAAYLGMWRPDAALPSGLYTPTLAGKFLQSWTPGGGSAGSYTSAGLPDIGGFASGLLMSVTPDSGGALLLYGPTGPDVQTINGDVNPWGYVDFKASRSNSIYGSSTSVMPESIALPYIIYLGQPA